MKQPATLLFFCFAKLVCFSQTPILLTNPSFEGNPGYGVLPGGWFSCSFNEESPPDTHPVEGGPFGVSQKPHEGGTYLGMVVRDNGTNELASQKLRQPFRAGQCYTFSVQLCRSEHLLSLSRVTAAAVDYDKPTVLRIWGGVSPCGKKELLAVSPPINTTAWTKYTFQVKSLETLDYLTMEAYFIEGASSVYNGNLLIDNISPIIPLDCESLQPLVDADTLRVPRYIFRKSDPSAQNRMTPTGFGRPIGNRLLLLNFNTVADIADLPAIILSNCERVGFEPGQYRLRVAEEVGLMEVGYNVRGFPGQLLEVAITDRGDRMNKRRAKAVVRAFKEVGLTRRQFNIGFVTSNADMTGWHCGNKEVWLRVVPKD